MAGLGRSSTAVRDAVAGFDEARDHLAHPVLGARLRQCGQALLDLPCSDAQERPSPMTLFGAADPDGTVFPAVLAQYLDGPTDPATLERL